MHACSQTHKQIKYPVVHVSIQDLIPTLPGRKYIHPSERVVNLVDVLAIIITL